LIRAKPVVRVNDIRGRIVAERDGEHVVLDRRKLRRNER
jgi:hypothetical protein